jgi:hypothetical protein
MIIPALKLSGLNEMPVGGHPSQSARAVALGSLPRIYHSEGAFLASNGQRFDIVFADLQKDPALPGYCFPVVGEIERTLEVRFIRRAGRHRCSVWNWDSHP